PGAMVGRLVLPSGDRTATLVLMVRRVHGDFDTSDEVSVYFDQYSGRVLAVQDQGTRTRTAGDVVMATIGPLHTGAIGGMGVQAAWSVIALSFPVLAATGALMWWHRRRAS